MNEMQSHYEASPASPVYFEVVDLVDAHDVAVPQQQSEHPYKRPRQQEAEVDAATPEAGGDLNLRI